jgi:hydrogenase-4 component B
VKDWIEFGCGLIGLLYLAAVGGAFGGRTRQHRFYFWSNWGALAAGVVTVVVALLVLVTGVDWSATFQGPLAWMQLTFRLDGLTAFFLFTLGLLASLVAIYALGYECHITRPVAIFQPLFLLSLTGLLAASDILSFLFFWELMSLTSYFLIVAGSGGGPKKAGFLYLMMTQFGTAFIMLAVLTLAAGSGGTSFAGLNTAGMAPAWRGALLVALFIGFGTKAGIVPLHIWLPKAHPAAPAPVSALLSGFMIKAALYGLLRFVGFFQTEAWFGALLMLMGGISAVLGILYAFMAKDFKRLLAYCSIENMGLLFLTAGVYCWGWALGNSRLTGLALAALEMHLLNHALFKGLLFMSAGALLQGCGTVDLDKMGGLIKRMPQTACFTLIGCMAGAGLPLVSGFVSEWLILQMLFLAALLAPLAWMKLIVFTGIGMVALSAGLAGATFVKLFGTAFLALPRSPQSRAAREVNRPMRLAMGLAAGCCLLLGIVPWLGWRLITFSSGRLGRDGAVASHPVMAGGLFGEVSGQLAGILAVLAIVALTVWLVRRKLAWRTGTTWNCGATLQPSMGYTGTGFAKMGRLAFGFWLRPQRRVLRPAAEHPLFPGPLEYRSQLPSHFEERLYRPGARLLLKVSAQVRRVQAGSIKLYLGYILAVLVLLLIYIRWF